MKPLDKARLIIHLSSLALLLTALLIRGYGAPVEGSPLVLYYGLILVSVISVLPGLIIGLVGLRTTALIIIHCAITYTAAFLYLPLSRLLSGMEISFSANLDYAIYYGLFWVVSAVVGIILVVIQRTVFKSPSQSA